MPTSWGKFGNVLVQLAKFAFQTSVASGSNPGSVIRSMYWVVFCSVHAVVVVDEDGFGDCGGLLAWVCGLAEQPAARTPRTNALAANADRPVCTDLKG